MRHAIVNGQLWPTSADVRYVSMISYLVSDRFPCLSCPSLARCVCNVMHFRSAARPLTACVRLCQVAASPNVSVIHHVRRAKPRIFFSLVKNVSLSMRRRCAIFTVCSFRRRSSAQPPAPHRSHPIHSLVSGQKWGRRRTSGRNCFSTLSRLFSDLIYSI